MAVSGEHEGRRLSAKSIDSAGRRPAAGERVKGHPRRGVCEPRQGVGGPLWVGFGCQRATGRLICRAIQRSFARRPKMTRGDVSPLSEPTKNWARRCPGPVGLPGQASPTRHREEPNCRVRGNCVKGGPFQRKSPPKRGKIDQRERPHGGIRGAAAIQPSSRIRFGAPHKRRRCAVSEVAKLIASRPSPRRGPPASRS